MSALGSGQAVENLRERQPCEAQCGVQLGDLESQIQGPLGAVEGIELSALTLQIGYLRPPITEHPQVPRLFGCCCHGGYLSIASLNDGCTSGAATLCQEA